MEETRRLRTGPRPCHILGRVGEVDECVEAVEVRIGELEVAHRLLGSGGQWLRELAVRRGWRRGRRGHA